MNLEFSFCFLSIITRAIPPRVTIIPKIANTLNVSLSAKKAIIAAIAGLMDMINKVLRGPINSNPLKRNVSPITNPMILLSPRYNICIGSAVIFMLKIKKVINRKIEAKSKRYIFNWIVPILIPTEVKIKDEQDHNTAVNKANSSPTYSIQF